MPASCQHDGSGVSLPLAGSAGKHTAVRSVVEVTFGLRLDFLLQIAEKTCYALHWELLKRFRGHPDDKLELQKRNTLINLFF